MNPESLNYMEKELLAYLKEISDELRLVRKVLEKYVEYEGLSET